MFTQQTVDYHTGGEPFRIVEPSFEIEGCDVPQRRVAAIGDERVQHLRQVLGFEPRGHADMYGGFIVPPNDEGAHFGVLFWHKDGFSTACGHGTIALGAWAVETGRVEAQADGATDVVIDVPSGRVTARVNCTGGIINDIDFINVPSALVAPSVVVETSWGKLNAAVGYGGALYAQVNCAELGLSVSATDLPKLIEIGREVQRYLNGTEFSRRGDDRLSGIYGTIFFEDHGRDDDGAIRQTNVTVFADGEVDRSPCGSGTASRVAVLAGTGLMADDDVLRHASIVGSEFIATITGRVLIDDVDHIIPSITGTAYLTGRHEFVVDDRDSLVPGFVLR
jgi:proline racemase/trans-L-3-hydroxyproline dehydratase